MCVLLSKIELLDKMYFILKQSREGARVDTLLGHLKQKIQHTEFDNCWRNDSLFVFSYIVNGLLMSTVNVIFNVSFNFSVLGLECINDFLKKGFFSNLHALITQSTKLNDILTWGLASWGANLRYIISPLMTKKVCISFKSFLIFLSPFIIVNKSLFFSFRMFMAWLNSGSSD